MGARFRVLLVGRPRSGWADAAVDDYTRRMRRLGGIEEDWVKAETYRGDVDAVRQAEGKRLLKASKGRLVALDERGRDLDSDGFLKLVKKGRRQGALEFAIGGAYGLDPQVRDEAWRVVRLSSLVMNHELARVVLYEQVYRAMTRIRNIPYHH